MAAPRVLFMVPDTASVVQSSVMMANAPAVTIGEGAATPARHDPHTEGPFVNPRIEGFGPVRRR
jgi:hypothetical protein